WFNFPVAITDLGTQHNAVVIRAGKLVTVATHPSNLTGRVAEHESIIWYILGNHRPCPHKCIAPHCYSAENGRVCPDCAAPLENCCLIERVPVHLGAGITHVS